MHLGLDIGTSAVKAVLSDGRTRIFASAEVALPPPSRPRPGWSEQRPEDWWKAARECLAKLRAASPRRFSAARALGLSGQMHGVAALDASNRPLRPAILWDDSRAARECRTLERRVPGLSRIAGVRAMPGLSAPKILWLEKHEPEVRRRVRKILPPKDYVRLKLTGERCTDRSDAAGTLWLDQARRDWSGEILSACNLSRDDLPELAEGSEPRGKVLPQIARDLGLSPAAAVAGGAGDCAAAAISAGAVTAGASCLSFGTAAVYVAAAAAHRPAPETGVHAFCHALPNLWMQMSAMLNGASCLQWAADILGTDPAGADRLAAAADRRARPDSGRAIFLPYLRGERTPHNDPAARGSLVGMGPSFERGDFARAVMEGVAMTLALGRDLLSQAGANPAPPIVVGGGAQSRAWMQILADFLNEPVRIGKEGASGPALGAARLARLSDGGESVSDVCPPPPIAREFFPRPGRLDECAALRTRFDKLYPALRPGFRAAARFSPPKSP